MNTKIVPKPPLGDDLFEEPIYRHFYDDTRARVMALSGLSATVLDEAARELDAYYEDCLQYYVLSIPNDHYEGFLALSGFFRPGTYTEGSSLNGLTLAQYFLVWAWSQNNEATYYLDGDPVAHGLGLAHAQRCGITAVISAAKTLLHAEHLMGVDQDNI